MKSELLERWDYWKSWIIVESRDFWIGRIIREVGL